jgi:ElaA protein
VELRWHDRAFTELSVGELYAIVQLREAVFVVEQTCPYLDADGLDPSSRHLFAVTLAGELHAYLRIVPPAVKYAEISLGRIVTSPTARRGGLGKELVRRGLAAVGDVPVRIGAQLYLERFYHGFGFERAGEEYVEDGIPHVEMLRSA